MLKCSTCKEIKPFAEFSINKNKSRGYSYICKACVRINSKNFYLRNREKQLKILKEKTANIKQYLIQVKNVPCYDCNIKYEYYIMEFAYRSGNIKEFKMASGACGSLSLARIQAELTKCDIVCSNCNRIRKHNEREIKKLQSL